MNDIKIVVLNRGWVVVGRVEEEGNKVIITSGSIIRRWGSSKGLGEIAEKGPLKETILDKCTKVKAHELTICFLLDVNQEKWSKHC